MILSYIDVVTNRFPSVSNRGEMTMQTFVPYASLKKTAESLDRARLGKQRSESKIILNVLEAKKSGRHLTKKNGLGKPPCCPYVGGTRRLSQSLLYRHLP